MASDAPGAASSGSSGEPPAPQGHQSGRKLIVILNAEIDFSSIVYNDGEEEERYGSNSQALAHFLESKYVDLIPLFGSSTQELRSEAAALKKAGEGAEEEIEVPDLSVYYRVVNRGEEGDLVDLDDQVLDELVGLFLDIPGVEGAYIEPPTELASFTLMNYMVAEGDPPTVTPDFSSQQLYLQSVDKGGIGTISKWQGRNVKIVDVEMGWCLTHENLIKKDCKIHGFNSDIVGARDHGTAVLGVLIGSGRGSGINGDNSGIIGISPAATVEVVSWPAAGNSVAQAIRMAANRLSVGDILLIEVHRPGPKWPKSGDTQFGYIAVEWWPADFDAIQYAVAKGIIVVEAAGNGGQNLDDPVYSIRPNGHPDIGTFPSRWRNPFNPSNPTSGAVVVGAGMPPAGTHGRTSHPNLGEPYVARGRCFFSNYGARVDAQGWGWEVTTTGYADLQGGSDENRWYTDQFSGTSSASPIVVGALACVQEALRASNLQVMNSQEAIQLLRHSGSPQQDAPGFTFSNAPPLGYPKNHPAKPSTQRIGNLPNLQQMIDRAISWRKSKSGLIN